MYSYYKHELNKFYRKHNLCKRIILFFFFLHLLFNLLFSEFVDNKTAVSSCHCDTTRHTAPALVRQARELKHLATLELNLNNNNRQ